MKGEAGREEATTSKECARASGLKLATNGTQGHEIVKGFARLCADVQDEIENPKDGQNNGIASEEAEAVVFGAFCEFPVGMGEELLIVEAGGVGL